MRKIMNDKRNCTTCEHRKIVDWLYKIANCDKGIMNLVSILWTNKMRGRNKIRKRPAHWMPGDSAISACGRLVTTPAYIADTESDVTCNTCRKKLKLPEIHEVRY